MAYDTSKLTKLSALKALAEKVKADYATKTELAAAASDATAALKSGGISGNTISLYTTADKSGDAAVIFDIPQEMFLDQTKTTFVAKFAWSNTTYSGSTNPNLDGKPVMVLAVKGTDNDGKDANDTISYSFLNMAALVDTYTAKAGDGTATVSVSGYEISVNVNVSAVANNALVKKSDGLYIDITGKADKVSGATSGNFAALDANGNLTDSGNKASDFVTVVSGKGLSTNDFTNAYKTKLDGISTGANKVTASDTNGHINIDGADTTVYTEPSDVVHGAIATETEVSDMLAEVFKADEA